GRAVLDPLARVSDDGLTAANVEMAAPVSHPKQTAQHHSELLELGGLARLDPAAGAAHVGNADVLVARIHAPDVLVDQLRLVACGLDASRRPDKCRHDGPLRL